MPLALIAAESGPLDAKAEALEANQPVWSLIKQLPYKLIVGGAFVLGCALLHLYLVSIDYVPTDLVALLGLATLVSKYEMTANLNE